MPRQIRHPEICHTRSNISKVAARSSYQFLALGWGEGMICRDWLVSLISACTSTLHIAQALLQPPVRIPSPPLPQSALRMIIIKQHFSTTMCILCEFLIIQCILSYHPFCPSLVTLHDLILQQHWRGYSSSLGWVWKSHPFLFWNPLSPPLRVETSLLTASKTHLPPNYRPSPS